MWSWRRYLGRAHGPCQAHAAPLVLMEPLLCQPLSPAWPQAYARVGHILPHTVRASSAVACMHRVGHRQVSQGMLDRKRLCWNCRTLTHGKRRGACPSQLLGLSLPTDDWWELLQMDPEELAQKLSTQGVMV